MADEQPSEQDIPSSSRGRGRPRKHKTEAEARDAKQKSDREYAARNRSAETDIEREFKRIQSMLISYRQRLAKLEQNPNVHRRSDAMTPDELRAQISQLEPQVAAMEPQYRAALKERHKNK